MASMDDKNRAREKYNLALSKAKEGMYQESLSLLEEALHLDPSLFQSYILMGKVYLKISEVSKAKKSWEKALQLDPYNMTARTCLDALARSAFPWWPVSISILFIIFIALQLISLVNFNRKSNEYAVLIKKEVKEGHNSIIDTMNKKLDSLDASITDIKKGLPSKKENLGQREKMPGKTRESIENTYEKAVYLFLEKKYEESRDLLTRIPIQDAKQSLKDNIIFWTGMNLYKEKKYPQALEKFQKVIELYPEGNKVPEAKKLVELCQKKMALFTEPQE